MRLVIISDSHDNLTNFKKVIAWAEKEEIKIRIHCGNICAPLG